MKARNLIGFAALALVATTVSAFALNAFVGAPTASADGSQRHRGGESLKYDADVEQKCRINIEFSEIRRSDVCMQQASVDQAGSRGRGHGGTEYDTDVDQKCDVNIEFSQVKDTDICKPKARVQQGTGAKASGGHEHKDGRGDGRDGRDDGRDGKDGGHHEGGRDSHRGGDYTNQEKTTCEAKGLLAVNQCDVGRDANLLSLVGGGGGLWDKRGDDYSRDGGRRGGDYTNQEKTTCEAKGLLAVNQCDVDRDANLLSSVGGLTRGIPLAGGLI